MAFGLLQQINWPLRCDRAGSVQDCGGQEGCEGQSCRVSGRAGEPVEGSDRSKIDLIAISRHWACPHARVGSLSVSRRAPPGAPSAWFRTDFRSESLTRPLRALARCTTLNTVFPYKVAAAWKAEAGIPARSFFFTNTSFRRSRLSPEIGLPRLGATPTKARGAALVTCCSQLCRIRLFPLWAAEHVPAAPY